MTLLVRACELLFHISIHMPHTWHDVFAAQRLIVRMIFQSTCHIRGMTAQEVLDRVQMEISIHMPHTWHDLQATVKTSGRRHFNPHATYVA